MRYILSLVLVFSDRWCIIFLWLLSGFYPCLLVFRGLIVMCWYELLWIHPVWSLLRSLYLCIFFCQIWHLLHYSNILSASLSPILLGLQWYKCWIFSYCSRVPKSLFFFFLIYFLSSSEWVNFIYLFSHLLILFADIVILLLSLSSKFKILDIIFSVRKFPFHSFSYLIFIFWDFLHFHLF